MSHDIYWLGDRFHCSNEYLEVAHDLILESKLNAKHICKVMQILGFDLEMICLELTPKRQLFFYPNGLPITKEGFTIKEMGTGFNICFNLIGYVRAAMSLGVALRVYSGSFETCLHPLLYRSLTDYFQSDIIGVYKQCIYFADSEYLKCTVNPSTPCRQCEEAPTSFKNTSIEWVCLGTWQHILKYREVEKHINFSTLAG